MYAGEIQLIDEKNIQVASLPFDIEVLPFVLGPSRLETSLYYRGKLSPVGSTASSEFKSEKQLRAELSNMKEHGVTNPTVYQRLLPKGGAWPTYNQ